ncbi:MAG: hypothetical protein R2682_14690 [Pyrinomonadaceae bacterium]
MAFGEEAITAERNVGVGYGIPPVRQEWLSAADAASMWFWGSIPIADAMGYMLVIRFADPRTRTLMSASPVPLARVSFAFAPVFAS